jgi:hypothetical protein
MLALVLEPQQFQVLYKVVTFLVLWQASGQVDGQARMLAAE